MPTFKNQAGFTLIPDNTIGIYTVTKAEASMDPGAAGKYTLHLDIHDEQGRKLGSTKETLVDSEKADWKIDQFLRSSNAVEQYGLKEGQQFEFIETRAMQKRVPWVDLEGLRGWCKVTVEDYTSKKDGSTKQANRVTFLDDHGMVPRVASEFED